MTQIRHTSRLFGAVGSVGCVDVDQFLRRDPEGAGEPDEIARRKRAIGSGAVAVKICAHTRQIMARRLNGHEKRQSPAMPGIVATERGVALARLDRTPDGRPLGAIDVDIRKRGDDDNVDAV